MDLATFIAQERDRKGQSFRDLEKRADGLSHAYIWRLAKGDQTGPSADALRMLGAALELTERQQRVLELLAKAPIEDSLYHLISSRGDLRWDAIEGAVTMSFRGARPTNEADWLKRISSVAALLDS
jgi:transcriptional regulator with XRE-family HTH domain